jgi:cell division protein FtsQ
MKFASSAASSCRLSARPCRASGGRAELGWVPASRKPVSRTAVLALPSRPTAFALPIGRLLPSGRALLIGFAAVAAVVGGYFAARETSMFAVKKIEVTGARPAAVRRVDAALEPLDGTSLLALDGAAIDQHLSGLRDVKLVSYDRAFPHTMRIVISAERPVAVLRRGSQAWIVTERGRVLEQLADPHASRLPRIWTADAPVPSAGELLTAEEALRPALLLGGVLWAGRTFFGRVREARDVEGDLVLVLGTGTEVRLGAADDLPLQLAVATHVLETVGPGAQYVDVSVPERAVVR